MFTFRLMKSDDIDAVFRIQAECYPESMIEPPGLLSSRCVSAPGYSLVALHGEEVCGYLFTFPTMLGRLTCLGEEFIFANSPDTLYFHDLGVAKAYTGNGIANSLISLALGNASTRDLPYAALVSIKNMEAFWEKFEFRKFSPLYEAEKIKLQPYGKHAFCMIKELS